VILSVCPHDKTKTAEPKIATLGTGIVVTLPRPPVNIAVGQRSRSQVTKCKTYLRLNYDHQPCHKDSTPRILIPHPTINIRSSQTRAAVVKRTRTPFGKRAFSACCPSLWNSLPPAVRNIDSHPAFRRALKSHLFYCAFIA